MKKQILLTHQTITALKALSPARERGFIRLVWAILEHAVRQSQKGKAEEVGIVNDIRQFVSYLNEKYPIDGDESEGYEKHFELEGQTR
ncbi:TPA: hypothetical protein I7164_18815 [Vibrio vulnificus]|uniref:hypothetical protein n=1 Tax=Vibrio vulnificus TaxID=672 RepID=UPI0019D45067|nr:hypothetical protein [Vibrio vulnificus]MBN8144704.1 hypothetical protein [Vibrio vulnificus]HAS6163111.1 hypothetical protein [Vibrio vulnificus]